MEHRLHELVADLAIATADADFDVHEVWPAQDVQRVVIGTMVAQKVFANSDAVRLALGVGFLGAYTTFSTFEFETHALLDDGEWLTATTNMVASLFVGLLAVRAGIVTARAWLL